MATLSVRLPDDLYKRLETLCDEIDREKIYVIKQAIETFLEERGDELIAITRLMKNEKEFDLKEVKAGTFKIGERASRELSSLSNEDQKSLVDYLGDMVSQENDPKTLGTPFINGRSGLWHFICNDLNIICSLNAKEILVIRISKKEELLT